MEDILVKLRRAFPAINFVPGPRFYWSPTKNKVIYKANAKSKDNVAVWSLFHELGHALLGHNIYTSDFELIGLEIAAWHKAKGLASDFGGNKIDDEHIEDCLDTYRNWLYLRSTCPQCTNCSLQIDSTTYCCFNCGASWRVSASRLCRAYRRKQKEILV